MTMNVVLVLAALGLAVQAAHCPEGCSCRESVLSCSNPPLELLPGTTVVLSIHTETPLDLLPLLETLQNATLPNLFQLDLANCSIDSLANGSFNSLLHLRSLDLSHNDISELPQDADNLYGNLTALRTLDLSGNLIRSVCGSPFRTLSALRLLNLSANAIEVISVDSLRGPELLQSLDLSANNLTELPDRVFVPLVSLQHLNLSGNKLRTLADGCFGSLLRLQQLDVSWNQLKHVAPSSLQALPSLSRLLLADNPDLGGSVKEAALLVGTGRRLQTVDASRTGLKHVPATLTHSVRTLRLAGNVISAVRCGDLDSYPLLQLLDLTANNLNEIEEDALGRLEMLTVLYLTNNKLRALPRSLPDHLEILHLEFNRIEQIVSGDLLGLPKLEVLLLNDNVIKVVQEGAFSQVSSLITLDLSNNPISILPGDTLAGPVRLQMLRLSELTVDPPAEDMAFPIPAPEHLVRLDLSGSSGLARQLLADTAALAAFRELQELNLANVDLINIRSDLLHYLPQMHEFHLTGNRLNCTGLLWLALWMRRQDLLEYRQVTCFYPPELYGTLVVDLQDIDVQEITYFSTLKTTTVEYKSNTTQNDSETTIASSWAEENAFNNITLEEQVNRSSVRILQNTKVEKVGHVSDRRTAEGLKTSAVPGARKAHRSTATPVAGQLHLFPIATRLATATEMGPSTDTTEAAPVSDGHIDEINPSDNRVATEPSNYATAVSGEDQTTAVSPTTTLSYNKRVPPPHDYVNQPDNFFPNKTHDNLSTKILPQTITAAQMARRTQDENVIIAPPEKVTSMYSAGVTTSHTWMGVRPTPALFALLAAALGAGAALCSLVSHVRKRRRRNGRLDSGGYGRYQDIEVNSLTSAYELW